MTFSDFLPKWLAADVVSTEDVLASILPLMREVVATHRSGFVAPLEGLQDVNVEGNRIWFEEAKRRPERRNAAEVARLEQASRASVEVLAEARRVTDVVEGETKLSRLEIAERGTAMVRPVYLPGYVAWEHEIGHHDPLTDVFSLGMLLASLSCRLNLSEPADLESFVQHRRNLFALNSSLHPALAQAIFRMTELERHRRAQDLPAVVKSLENYRDQTIPLEFDLARIPGFQRRDAATRREIVLSRLRDRLFDLSRRNNLLHFRTTMQSVNLTQSSIPVLFDIKNIRPEQVLVWNEHLRDHFVAGRSISFNKHLNFSEALYLPSLLDRLIADARRDHHEFGFIQLRLVACFLAWSNLKEQPAEQFFSPLVLLPVRLVKTKGIRDTYALEPLSSEAEINPVVRHQFRQLYNIELPEVIDLTTTRLETLHEFLAAQVRASEPSVTLNLLNRPRIDLIHEKARRRLDQYRRNARIAGRGVRHFGSLDYSYDPANYHPLGIKLFSTRVRTPGSHLRDIIEEKPRPRSFFAAQSESEQPPTAEVERSFYQVRDSIEENPYFWNFDLCNLTLANFRYRRMSLVRDYETILGKGPESPSFDATFSLMPRPSMREPAVAGSLDDRYDVIAADPTQAAAVAEAQRGASYIIQGPPGTGKSQTITNLIADFAARGKRVLFVCEKRAAIDVVFARLRQCGLSPLCTLIHDSQTDKKEFVMELKQTYEQFLVDANGRRTARRKRIAVLERIKTDLTPLSRFETVMESPLGDSEMSVRRFLDRAIELSGDRPVLTPEDAEGLPNYAEWLRHADRLRTIDDAIRVLEPSGIFARHPLRRLAPALRTAKRPIETVSTAMTGAKESLDRLVQAQSKAGLPPDQWNTLRRARILLDYLSCAAPVCRRGNLELVDPAGHRAKTFAIDIARIAAIDQKLATARSENTAWRRKLPPKDLESALIQARAWEQRYFAWLSPAWWRLRKVLRANYDFNSHVVRPTWVQVLGGLESEFAAAIESEQAIAKARAAFSLDESPVVFEQRLAALRTLLSRAPDWLRRIHAALVKLPKAELFVEWGLLADEPARRLREALESVLIDFEDLKLSELERELAAVARAARQTPQFMQLLGELELAPPVFGESLRNRDLTIRQFEAAVAHATWDALLRGDGELRQFDERRGRQSAARLESSYDGWLKANAAEILDNVRKRFLENVRMSSLAASQLSPEQREFKRAYAQGRRALEHEFGKSMRYRAIRELVEGETAQVIKDLKPVWLMSPLSVSDTLPLATDLFDVVIFDEASQVPLEESVPTLFRGRQVIVVGDEMQLPPTNFFAARQANDDDETAVAENGEHLSFELDSESLLNHAARNLPSTMLGWHYRSRSESLISFSNWAFYDGRLLTVPERRIAERSPARESTSGGGERRGVQQLLNRALSFHWLKDGVYDQRRNRREAEYIAELICDLLKRGAGLSIGVIAFSEAQQGEIEAALDRLSQTDEEFRALYEVELEREIDGQFVGLLVKNLENIQGDERDVVILSVCYGPGPNGKMLMNFGPINKTGGEKRLNVAFSRAKQHMAIVSSIQSTAITNEYNDGASCLKNYLSYAEAMSSGDLERGRRVLAGICRWRDAATTEGFEDDQSCCQLARELRKRGYEVDTNVGQSHFRVDLAVRRPQETQYRLGILIDLAVHYEQTDALERDMMRPRLLRSFGWRIAGVLAKDWYLNRDGELGRIVTLLEGGEDKAPCDDIAEEPPDDEEASSTDDEPFVQNGDELNAEELDEDHVLPEVRNSANRETIESWVVDVGTIQSTDPATPMRNTAQAIPSVIADGEVRHLEFRDDKSSKFWEIRLAGTGHTVRFGRIGTAGQSQTKVFQDAAQARRDADRLVREKLRKGYQDSSAST